MEELRFNPQLMREMSNEVAKLSNPLITHEDTLSGIAVYWKEISEEHSKNITRIIRSMAEYADNILSLSVKLEEIADIYETAEKNVCMNSTGFGRIFEDIYSNNIRVNPADTSITVSASRISSNELVLPDWLSNAVFQFLQENEKDDSN